jgi:hypothetical protein
MNFIFAFVGILKLWVTLIYEWLNSTRLVTRTEESGIYASSTDDKSSLQNESKYINIYIYSGHELWL